jgi:hypothetical protein
MTTRTTARIQFLNDVITTAVEGGIGHWASPSAYNWGTDKGKFSLDGTPYPTTVTIYEEEDEGNFRFFPLTIDAVASAIRKISRGESQISEDRVKTIVDASRENDGGDIDADLADCIVQVAVLGDVVYG